MELKVQQKQRNHHFHEKKTQKILFVKLCAKIQNTNKIWKEENRYDEWENK